MHKRILIGSLIAAALFTVSCQQRATQAANTGSPPAVDIPVGPAPGPPMPETLPTNPYAGNNVALSQGRQLFVQYNCYGCHGGHGGGGMGPNLRNHETYSYGSDDAHVFASIAQGRAKGMPAWGTKLPRDQIWMLAAYVESLSTNSEPQPPPPFPGDAPANEAAVNR